MAQSTHVSTDIGRWAMVPLWLVKRLTAEQNGTAALTTFIALHQWIDRDKECHPSVASIAEVAGTSEATVRRGLRLLEDIGAVVTQARWSEDGDRTSNRYLLRYVDQSTREETSPQIRQDPPSQIRQDPPCQIREGKESHSEGEPSEGENTLAHASVSMTTPAEFDRFWSTYPRKVGKGAARNRWTRMSAGDRQAALGAVEHHAARWSRERTEVRFIPHPATWLGQQRWLDDLTTEARHEPTMPSAVRHAADLLARVRAQSSDHAAEERRLELSMSTEEEWL